MKFKLYFGGTLENDNAIGYIEALDLIPNKDRHKIAHLKLGERHKDEDGDVWERIA